MAHLGTPGRGALCARGALTLTLAALAPLHALAEEDRETVELSWVRAEGGEACPDVAALRAGVVRRLGRDPFGSAPGMSVEAVVRREAEQWGAHIYARRGTEALGTRALQSTAPSCDSLADAVALAIALVIDPEAVARQARVLASSPPASPPAQPAPVATRPPSHEREPGAPSSPAHEGRATRDTPHVAVDALAVAALGVLPGTAWGVALDARVPLPFRLAIGAGFAFFPEREVTALGGRFAFGLTTALLGVCAEPFAPALFGLEACAQAELGSVHAVVYRLEPTVPGDRFFGAGAATLRLVLRPGAALRISLGIGAAAPFVAYRFSVRGKTEPAFAQAAVAGSASLGLGVGF